jgi:uncharacterized phage-associated protein
MTLDFRPKIDKIVELLLYLAHVRPNADKYQAVKFFYLADREHLNRYGRPITHEAYFALPYGPVASKAMDLLEEDHWTMTEAGIETLPFEIERTKQDDKPITYIRAPKREVNRALFSKSDLKVFDDIIEKYGKSSFEELFEITHDHYAYKKAWKNRRPGSKRSQMFYEDMIEDRSLRESVIENIGPFAANME